MLEEKNFLGSIQEGEATLSQSEKEIKTQRAKQISETTSRIAKSVISEMEKQSIPLFPANFEAYFDKIVNTVEDESYRKIIQKISENEHDNQDRFLNFEMSVRDGFKSVRDVLEITRNIYQELLFVQNMLSKRQRDLPSTEGSARHILELISQDLHNVRGNIENELAQMREAFENITNKIQDVNENAIFDTQYGIYGKKYFLALCAKEREVIAEVQHQAFLVVLSPSKAFLNHIKDKALLKTGLKSIAKLLVKHLNINDLICYFGSGRFALLCKYTDIEKVKESTTQFLSLLKETNVLSEEGEMSLELCAGIAPLNQEYTLQESVMYALSALDEAMAESISYKVHQD